MTDKSNGSRQRYCHRHHHRHHHCQMSNRKTIIVSIISFSSNYSRVFFQLEFHFRQIVILKWPAQTNRNARDHLPFMRLCNYCFIFLVFNKFFQWNEIGRMPHAVCQLFKRIFFFSGWIGDWNWRQTNGAWLVSGTGDVRHVGMHLMKVWLKFGLDSGRWPVWIEVAGWGVRVNSCERSIPE